MKLFYKFSQQPIMLVALQTLRRPALAAQAISLCGVTMQDKKNAFLDRCVVGLVMVCCVRGIPPERHPPARSLSVQPLHPCSWPPGTNPLLWGTALHVARTD